MNLDELLESEMTVRSIMIERKDEVFAKGIAQANDGLCCVFSCGGGRLLFAAAKDRAADLDELIADLKLDLLPEKRLLDVVELNCTTEPVPRAHMQK